MPKNNAKIIRFPIQKTASKPPRPPRGTPKETAQGPFNNFVFNVTYSGLPARMVIEVAAPNYREALGAAYLMTERFSTQTIAAIKQK